jgi:hypothetical protein
MILLLSLTFKLLVREMINHHIFFMHSPTHILYTSHLNMIDIGSSVLEFGTENVAIDLHK